MRTVNLLTDSSSEDEEGKKTIQVDGICTFGGMHVEYVTLIMQNSTDLST